MSGIVASIAFNPAKDLGLRLLDSAHLFNPSTTRIAIRTGQYLRGYAYRFLEFCSPILTEDTVRYAVLPAREPEIE